MTMRARWIVPTLYILFLLLPIYWLLNMSFKTTNEILAASRSGRTISRSRTTR
jgi:ABC-type glycerol-3-phosphate transport system permease component